MFLRELKTDSFINWLKAHGHEVMAPTNEWEVVRFRNSHGTGIIYKTKTDLLNFQGQAEKAYRAFKNGDSFTAGGKKRKRLAVDLKSIIRRDGQGCFYCGQHLEPEDMTREHMLSIAHGGSNHISNMVLACEPCNREAGHLSIAEKVRLREAKHGPQKIRSGER